MTSRRNRGTDTGPAGESVSDAPARRDRNDDDADRTSTAADDVTFSASASAPPAPVRGRVEGDREVEFGVPYSPPTDASRPADDSFERRTSGDVAARAPDVPVEPGNLTPSAGVPAVGMGLRTDDGRAVSVVHIVAELAPFARTGGLGEAVKSLAEFQSASGIPTAIIMPLYRQVHAVAPNLEPVGEPFMVQLGPQQEQARLFQITPDRRARSRNAPKIYFLDHPHFFDRPGLYGENGYDYPDNPRRYAFFSLAALLALPRVAPNAPVILHAHDWHAALASVYLRTYFMGDPYYRQVRTVLSVHNAGFQGQYPARTMADVGLPWELFSYRHLEWYERMNYLKGGLVFSDMVTTVSPTHAHELRTPFGGFGLHDTFIGLRDRFVGIVNGIDQRVWDPATDKQITTHYTADTIELK